MGVRGPQKKFTASNSDKIPLIIYREQSQRLDDLVVAHGIPSRQEAIRAAIDDWIVKTSKLPRPERVIDYRRAGVAVEDCHPDQPADQPFQRKPVVVDPSAELRCISCREMKEKQDFYPSRTNLSGVTGKCKVCYRKHVTARQMASKSEMARLRIQLGLDPRVPSPTSNANAGKRNGPHRKTKENWPAKAGVVEPIHAPQPSQEPPPSFNSLFHLPTPGKED